MSAQQTDGMDRIEEQHEQTFVERHGHVNEITVGTVLEYDDWQWALVTELAVDRDEPKLGFILLDEVGDHIVQQLETANGCRQHYEVVEHLCGGEHEYWAPVEYVVEDDIWSVLGPVHPDFRTVEDGEKELVTDGGISRPAVCVDTLDYDGAATHQDPIEGEVTRHYYSCPSCGHPVSTWMDCPECLWYDEDVWQRTLNSDTDHAGGGA